MGALKNSVNGYKYIQTNYLIMQSQFQQTIDKQGLILDRTLAICSNCFSITEGLIVEKEGKVFLEKNCCEEESIVIENDVDFYKKAVLPFKFDDNFFQIGMKRNGKEVKEHLMKKTNTLSFSLTFRCNMSCPICYEGSQAGKYDESCDMEMENIDDLLKHNKNKLICLSGGEPTLRMDLPDIIRKIVKSGNTPYLISNGLRFLDKSYIRQLKEAGLKSISLQFDGFKRESYIKLRGGDYLDFKLQIIKNLINEGINFWLFPVIMPEENEDQIRKILAFAAKFNKNIKGINFSPLFIGKGQKDVYTNSDILKIIEHECGIEIENYIESKKFRHNLYALAGKYLGNEMQQNLRYLLRTVIYLKVEKSKIEPLIKTKDLKKMNEILQQINAAKSKPSAILTLIKNLPAFLNKGLASLAAFIISNNFSLPSASQSSSKGLLKITMTNVTGAANEDLSRNGNVEDFSALPVNVQQN